MFLSQRIAKDANFLEKHGAGIYPNREEFREKVINSVKIIIGKNILAKQDSSMQDIKQKIYGTSTPNIQDISKRETLYSKFSRPPFPVTFLENSEIGYLVEAINDKEYSIIKVRASDGFHTPYKVLINNNLILQEFYNKEKNKLEYCNMREHNLETFFNIENYNITDKQIETLQTGSSYTRIIVSELLLYINAAGTRLHYYTPTKRENKMIPKVLQNRYVYRILDMYREKDKYVSLQEIIDHTESDDKQQVNMRAHLVMGHFKEKSGKLYWWNAFVRCKKSTDTKGVVDKDYRLND